MKAQTKHLCNELNVLILAQTNKSIFQLCVKVYKLRFGNKMALLYLL